MNSKVLKMVIYEVNGENFASDVMEVQKVLPYLETTKIPEAPEFIDGVINYEGSFLPVISLTYKLKREFNVINENSQILVVKDTGKSYGIIVDLVKGVKEIYSEDIKEAPEIASVVSKRYLKGLIKSNDEIIMILKLSNILNDEEKDLL